MNWSVITTYAPMLGQALLTTVILTVLTLVLSTIIGAPLAVLRDRGGIAGTLTGAFSWITRAIPVLVILFLIFYGLPLLGLRVSAFVCALIGLTFQAAGYNLEIIRGGLRAVHKQQYDSVRAMGLPRVTAWIRIILPQAVPALIPPYFSNATKILKATSIASVITVQEVTGVTVNLIGITYATIELLLLSAVLYVVVATVLVLLQAVSEKLFAFPT